jgi:hypothetical protein
MMHIKKKHFGKKLILYVLLKAVSHYSFGLNLYSNCFVYFSHCFFTLTPSRWPNLLQVYYTSHLTSDDYLSSMTI